MREFEGKYSVYMKLPAGGGYGSLGYNAYTYVKNTWRLGRGYRKVVLLCLLFFCLLSSLSAHNVEWSWNTENSEVKYYRYQLNSENTNDWTVVDSTVKSVLSPVAEGENIFYVEASYDGKTWSEPGTGTYFFSSDRYNRGRYELSFGIMPYALQKIEYSSEEADPDTRFSDYAYGALLGFAYNSSSDFSFAFNFSTEYYNFKDFHTYHDFKLDVEGKFSLFEEKNSRNKVYLNVGLGLDAVVRDDRLLGCYPMFVYGLEDSFMIAERISLALSCDLELTFQYGSTVFHVVPALSLRYHCGDGGEKE